MPKMVVQELSGLGHSGGDTSWGESLLCAWIMLEKACPEDLRIYVCVFRDGHKQLLAVDHCINMSRS